MGKACKHGYFWCFNAKPNKIPRTRYCDECVDDFIAALRELRDAAKLCVPYDPLEGPVWQKVMEAIAKADELLKSVTGEEA